MMDVRQFAEIERRYSAADLERFAELGIEAEATAVPEPLIAALFPTCSACVCRAPEPTI